MVSYNFETLRALGVCSRIPHNCLSHSSCGHRLVRIISFSGVISQSQLYLPPWIKSSDKDCHHKATNQINRHAPIRKAFRIKCKKYNHWNTLINVEREQMSPAPFKGRKLDRETHCKQDNGECKNYSLDIPSKSKHPITREPEHQQTNHRHTYA